MYQYLANALDEAGFKGHTWSWEKDSPLSRQYPELESARKWLEVAVCANGNFGMHSDFIRHHSLSMQ